MQPTSARELPTAASPVGSSAIPGLFFLLLLLLLAEPSLSKNVFSWMSEYDHFDEVNDHITTVTADNCQALDKEDLVLRPDMVNQVPVFNKLLSQIWYQNRTSLIHLHNMALNRAFFYSYILQKMNSSRSFFIQPNWLYMYMSAAADVNANPDGVNGSALVFDEGCHYPNWYQTVNFNNTLPLFGPKAWRHDDFRDQDNYLREPTRQVAMVMDLGAGRGSNYTHPRYKMNPWFTKWLPDTKGDMDSLTKFTYYVGIKYSNETGKFTKDEFESFPFFGPSTPSAEETDPRMLPVVLTQPYFDCGRSNKWVVSTVSPVVDFMPRYSNWTHLRRPRSVAAVVMDIDFREVDFNACDVGKGNPGPSYLSGIHRCRKTTNCKHRSGWGFQRGGYKCNCRPGKHWPWQELVPSWDGDILEQATEKEYHDSFLCLPTDFRTVLPQVDQLAAVNLEGGSTLLTSGGLDPGLGDVAVALVKDEELSRSRREANQTQHRYSSPFRRHGHVEVPLGVHADVKASHDRKSVSRVKAKAKATARHRDLDTAMKRSDTLWRSKQHRRRHRIPKKRRKRAPVFDEKSFNKMMRIFRHKASVTAESCRQMAPHSLLMSSDVSYGADKQFENEARTALRLSHFLSNFLQNVNPSENFGNLRGGGRLHEEHMFGEVLANVMGNFKILSAGVFFDKYQWEDPTGRRRELFGPWAYKKEGAYYALDSAGLDAPYTNLDWFTRLKERWVSGFERLKQYKMRSYIRSDPNGTSSVRHEHFPLSYKAPTYASGYWTRPHFRCDGQVDSWVITYVTPFFGLDTLRRKLQFKGVVTVDVPLGLLELNPCPMGFGVANAFKNTARCDYLSTSCKPIAGYPFTRGAYSCRCLHGFEYPHNDGKNWLHGTLIEMEYEKKIRGLFSRFDLLKCRAADASRLTSYAIFTAVLFFLSRLFR